LTTEQRSRSTCVEILLGGRHLGIAQDLLGSEVVLGGQHLGRGHHGTLMTSLNRREQGNHHDDGLAGANLAMEQPVHRGGCDHVCLDRIQGIPLTRSQLEREMVNKPGGQLSGLNVRYSTARHVFVVLAGLEHHLNAKKFVEDQALLRRPDIAKLVGKVDVHECR